MTNEERLHELSDKIIAHWWNKETPFEESLVQTKIRYRKEFSAILDAAREDEAIRFEDWIDEQGYWKSESNTWCLTEGRNQYIHIAKTTKELYQQFKKQNP